MSKTDLNDFAKVCLLIPPSKWPQERPSYAFDANMPNMLEVTRKLIADRRRRENHFDATLFADPAWDILLDLYAAHLEAKVVSVSALCAAAAVPAATALRWIRALGAAGLIERHADPNDKRRIYVHLSEHARDKMSDYLRDILSVECMSPGAAPVVGFSAHGPSSPVVQVQGDI